MQYGPEVIPVCMECSVQETSGLGDKHKLCEKCGIAFCIHYSSSTDIRFCANCMSDFSVSVETEIRITESSNSAGVMTYRKRDVCKSLKLQGTDWLFTSQKISTLTDEELDATIEYHKAVAGLMLFEREERRVERYANLSKTVIKLQNSANVDSTGAIRGSHLTPAQRAEREADKAAKKKTTTTKKSKSSADSATDALQVLIKAGLDPAKLAEMLKSLGGKK